MKVTQLIGQYRTFRYESDNTDMPRPAGTMNAVGLGSQIHVSAAELRCQLTGVTSYIAATFFLPTIKSV